MAEIFLFKPKATLTAAENLEALNRPGNPGD